VPDFTVLPPKQAFKLPAPAILSLDGKNLQKDAAILAISRSASAARLSRKQIQEPFKRL
jgi:hypothetical protein